MTSQALRNLSLEEMDKQSFLHPFTPLAEHLNTGPRIMARANGVTITDTHGRDYIDAMAGLWCVNVGYGRAEIADAIAEQARTLAYYHSFASMATEAPIRLADRLISMAPGNMSKVFFGCSGSDANDTQVKLVWYYNNLRGKPQKKKIIARHRGYHGVTVAAGSLSGLPVLHKAFDLPLERMLHVTTPHHYRGAQPGDTEADFTRALAAELDAVIEEQGPDTVAAFIAEPIMGAGGVIVPPEGYFDAIQAVLKKHDVLLIADEVICGFGRLGHRFGCEHFGIEPDLISIAKGVTSGYVPLSACIVSEEIWEVLLEGSRELGVFGHGYTYSAHPLAAAAAMANLDIFERDDLVGHAARVGGYLQQRLREAFSEHELVGEVRGVGLIAAIEVVADKASKAAFDPTLKVGGRLANACLEHGLISRALPNGDALAFSPPLVITESEIDAVVDRFDTALKQVADELARESAV